MYHYGGKWGEQRANGMGQGGREGVKTIEPKCYVFSARGRRRAPHRPHVRPRRFTLRFPPLKISQLAEQHISLYRIPATYNLPVLLLCDGARSAYRVKWMTVFTAGVVVNAY